MSKTVFLGPELIPMIDEMVDVLSKYPPVTQMKVLEMLVVRHSIKMGLDDPFYVADSVHKHVKQLITQFLEEEKNETRVEDN